MIVDHMSLQQSGKTISVMFKSKVLMSFSLQGMSLMNQNDDALRGKHLEKTVDTETENGDSVKVGHSDIQELIQVYSNLYYKHTKRHKNYSPTSKAWGDFSRAVAIAKSNDVDYFNYVKAIVNKYSEMNKTERLVFPYPRQLQGEFASEIISEYLLKTLGKVPEELKAKKQALTNQRLTLEKDELYQKIKARMKTGSHSKFDIEYCKYRHNQFFGEPKSWVLDKERELNDRK